MSKRNTADDVAEKVKAAASEFNKKGDVGECTRWLRCFGNGEEGWECFVNTFLFQDWVYCLKDGKYAYYDIIPLFQDHNWGNAITPLNNLSTFFRSYNERIYGRGNRILDKLKKDFNI